MRSFIGITAHFIISDWELRSAVLACRRITGRHTADNISAQYEEIVNEFNIADKVTHVVSDNASNMVKAFKLPGYVNSHSDSDDTSDTDRSSDTELDDDDPSDVFAHLPQHDGCFTHTVQLVVKDGMKAAGTLRSVIGKASNIVSHARKSTISTGLLEGHRKLQAANVTRWNSEITMIRSVLRIPQETLDQLDTMHKLTHHDRILLGELCEILASFEAATDFTQGDKVVTDSLVIPSVRGLRAQLAAIKAKYNCKMVQSLKKSVEHRLSAYEEQTSFQLAATLDPGFKLAWCKDTCDAQKQRTALLAAANLLATPLVTSTQTKPGSSASPPAKRCKLFGFMGAQEATPPVSSSTTEEISKYLAEPSLDEKADPVAYWHSRSTNLSIPAKLSLKYLAIPATSAPVERLFSVAGKVFRADRCRLTGAKFEALMFIKCKKIHLTHFANRNMTNDDFQLTYKAWML